MRRRLVVFMLLAVGACKGDRQQCETVCRHFYEVKFWETADPEIAAAPAEQRDTLKKKKLAEFSTKVEDGVEFCVMQCTSANNEDMNKCLLAAKTSAAIAACMK
jgi:hypothetical protein